jgi:hypothetical protein
VQSLRLSDLSYVLKRVGGASTLSFVMASTTLFDVLILVSETWTRTTYVLQQAPSLKSLPVCWHDLSRHASSLHWSAMTCFIASSRALAEKAPVGLAGNCHPALGVNAFSATFLYARMHSSTDIWSLPSIIAMILSRSSVIHIIKMMFKVLPSGARAAYNVEVFIR